MINHQLLIWFRGHRKAGLLPKAHQYQRSQHVQQRVANQKFASLRATPGSMALVPGNIELLDNVCLENSNDMQ